MVWIKLLQLNPCTWDIADYLFKWEELCPKDKSPEKYLC